jgi:hypothetical protein
VEEGCVTVQVSVLKACVPEDTTCIVGRAGETAGTTPNAEGPWASTGALGVSDTSCTDRGLPIKLEAEEAAVDEVTNLFGFAASVRCLLFLDPMGNLSRKRLIRPELAWAISPLCMKRRPQRVRKSSCKGSVADSFFSGFETCEADVLFVHTEKEKRAEWLIFVVHFH